MLVMEGRQDLLLAPSGNKHVLPESSKRARMGKARSRSLYKRCRTPLFLIPETHRKMRVFASLPKAPLLQTHQTPSFAKTVAHPPTTRILRHWPMTLKLAALTPTLLKWPGEARFGHSFLPPLVLQSLKLLFPLGLAAPYRGDQRQTEISCLCPARPDCFPDQR